MIQKVPVLSTTTKFRKRIAQRRQTNSYGKGLAWRHFISEASFLVIPRLVWPWKNRVSNDASAAARRGLWEFSDFFFPPCTCLQYRRVKLLFNSNTWFNKLAAFVVLEAISQDFRPVSVCVRDCLIMQNGDSAEKLDRGTYGEDTTGSVGELLRLRNWEVHC